MVYRNELRKILLTRDPDKLIEFSNEWAAKVENKRMSELKNQPREFVELAMHEMIAGISNIPDEIREESEKWLEEFRQNHPDPDDGTGDNLDDEIEDELFDEAIHMIHAQINLLKQMADKYPYLDSSKIPDIRHYADLPGIGAPRICFTKRDRNGDGKWFYHLSVSSREGRVDNESVNFLLKAFGSPQNVAETPGELNGGTIRHFWWPCDNDVIN